MFTSQDKSPNSQNLVIFGAIPHVSLINFIIRCSTTRTIFYDEDWGWGDPTYYVALGSKPHWILSAGPASGFFAYRPASVIFQLLFKCKVGLTKFFFSLSLRYHKFVCSLRK